MRGDGVVEVGLVVVVVVIIVDSEEGCVDGVVVVVCGVVNVVVAGVDVAVEFNNLINYYLHK